MPVIDQARMPQKSPVSGRRNAGGPHPVLRQAIASFVADVDALPAHAIQARWDAEAEAIRRDRTPSTQKLQVTKYRAALVEAFGPDHPALGVVNARGLHARIAAARQQAANPSSAAPAPRGRPSVLRDAVSGFVARLRTASTADHVQALWDAEMARHEGKADRTVKLYVVQYYRPAILAAFGDGHPALSVATLPDGLADRIRAHDRAGVAQSHRHLVAMPDWREIVAQGARLLRSSDPVALAVGLLCVTGRRPYEVFCTGRFAPAPVPGGARRACSRWSVMFSGQAKTKNRPGTRQEAYEIPVLAEARVVLAAFEALRASPEGRAWAALDNPGFSRLTTGAGMEERIPLAAAVVDAFGGLWPVDDHLTPKSLRPLYAEVAYHHVGPPSVSKNSFFSAILGHTLQDLETSLSYMDYHLGDDARAQASSARLAGRFLAEQDRRARDPDAP